MGPRFVYMSVQLLSKTCVFEEMEDNDNQPNKDGVTNAQTGLVCCDVFMKYTKKTMNQRSQLKSSGGTICR